MTFRSDIHLRLTICGVRSWVMHGQGVALRRELSVLDTSVHCICIVGLYRLVLVMTRCPVVVFYCERFAGADYSFIVLSCGLCFR